MMIGSWELGVRRQNNKISTNYQLPTENQKGFTLVELLVVMAVIGVLAIIGTPQYLRAQRRARDAIRKNDLAQIKRALELAKQDGALRGLYYPCGGGAAPNGSQNCTAATDPDWKGFGNSWPPYMPKIPRDPRNVSPNQYNYLLHSVSSTGVWSTCSSNCPAFRLTVTLEDTKDPDFNGAYLRCGFTAVPSLYVICSE